MSTLIPVAPADLPRLLSLDTPGWEEMLTLGRRHAVAGRWYDLLAAADALTEIPAPVRHHLWSERLIAAERVRMARWEANRVAHAFADSDIVPVLLKGAAYVTADLLPGRQRLLSDIDILVPSARLRDAERILNTRGWRAIAHSAYDDHYYRQWMHELPPMQHDTRGTVLDLHHNILPRTSRLVPDAAQLLDAAVPVPGLPLRMLAPADMVIHSILHGFYGGEFTNCFRDVLDVHELVSDLSARHADFWSRLAERIAQLRCEGPACYALTLAHTAFGTNLPDDLCDALARRASPWPVRAATLWAMRHVFVPALPPTFLQRRMLDALYMRSHWVKMPPRMLARHLWTKWRMRRTESPAG